MAAGNNLAGAFGSCLNISRIQAIFPASVNINLSSLSLGPVSANEIFSNLPLAVGSPRTITMSGNWATTQGSYNPDIAIAKGWTVVA
jgi:hypothetical protein